LKNGSDTLDENRSDTLEVRSVRNNLKIGLTPWTGQDPTWHRPPGGVAGRGRGLARSGRWGELLAVIERHGDRAMDFVWRHKGALTISTILATFLAEPEVFLGGGRELMSEAAQELTQPQVEAADSVAGRPLPAWPYPWR
jgi:hypothetical protein